MEILFLNENTGVISISKQAEKMECFKALKKYLVTKGKFDKCISYLFYTYSKSSIYYDYLEFERKGVVSKEIFGDEEKYLDVEKNKHFSLCLNAYLDISLSKNERILRDYYKSQEQSMELLRTFSVTTENISDHTKLLKNVKEQQLLIKQMDAIILDESEARNQGNSENTLIEEE